MKYTEQYAIKNVTYLLNQLKSFSFLIHSTMVTSGPPGEITSM